MERTSQMYGRAYDPYSNTKMFAVFGRPYPGAARQCCTFSRWSVASKVAAHFEGKGWEMKIEVIR